ncbi:unnamed protein product [Lactuca saligna]|uniref:Smr domain-containing protein n=1 Tax=Lactuca saligna TaxID=75948 RepID=A0AA35Z511_LACSI|nr:unnamed protein product [Lactuca saligna]
MKNSNTQWWKPGKDHKEIPDKSEIKNSNSDNQSSKQVLEDNAGSSSSPTKSKERKSTFKGITNKLFGNAIKSIVKQKKGESAPKTSEDSWNFDEEEFEEEKGWRDILSKLKNMNPFQNVKYDKKDVSYHGVRSRATKMWKEVQLLEIQVNAAHERGDIEKFNYLTEKRDKMKIMAKSQNMRDSYILYKARNKGINNRYTIDIHDQQRREGIMIVKINLWLAYNLKGIKVLNIITGYGSKTGKKVLKDETIALLNKKGIDFEEKCKGGVIRIHIDPNRHFTLSDSDVEDDDNCGDEYNNDDTWCN